MTTRLPFDWKTPTGYLLLGIVLVFLMTCLCHNSICVYAMLFGFFGVMMSFSSNIKRKFKNLCEVYAMSRNETKMKNDLRDFLLFHSEVEQFSKISKL